MAKYKIAIDAGHGGSDSGAVYLGRKEKDDNLKMALAIGKILENGGYDVVYIRDSDEYETPFKKATDANNSNANLFVSIHRNSSEEQNQYNGVETLVYKDTGIRAKLARNINNNLEGIGFKNLGVDVRPNLVVLKRTKMPAVLVEVGFINSDRDNSIFDNSFDAIAQAIADAIMDTVSSNGSVSAMSPVVSHFMPEPDNGPVKLYRVQVGAFSDRGNADRLLEQLQAQGYPVFIIYEDNLYKVQVGAFKYLTNAITMEGRLRDAKYDTYITT